MKKGTKVSWTYKSGLGGGSGVTVSDEVDGAVLVKATNYWKTNPEIGQRQEWENEEHFVLSCTVSWLTVVQ